MNKFKDRLKELRLEKGLSIQALAKEINISNATICRWENGITDITGENLIILSKFFGVTSDYLLGLED